MTPFLMVIIITMVVSKKSIGISKFEHIDLVYPHREIV